MNRKIKQALTFSSMMSCFIATTLFGDSVNNKSNTSYATPKIKNPSEESPLNYYIGAYYTYWAPYVENSAVAYADGTAIIQGSQIFPDFTAQSGFKISAGANTRHDGWVLGLNYAWFNNQPSLKTTHLSNLDYISYFPSSPTTLYNAFETQFKNQFNRIDAQLDWSFFSGQYFTFRRWLGILAAWDQESLNVYQTTTTDQIQAVNVDQNWWGIGPYTGGEGAFYFTNTFCGFISSGVGMLLTNHKVTTGSLNVDSNHVTTAVLSNMFTEYNNMEPMLEASLGVRWEETWPNWGLCIDLTWETQTYFSHIFLSQVSAGNYSMQGLTLGATISF